MTSNEQNERFQTNVFKGLAIIGVIILHVLSSSGILSTWTLDRTKPLFFLDQIFRFTVPIFIFLSGFALGRKYFQKKLNLYEFITRRLLKLLPLYLFWVAVILLVVHLVPGWGAFADSFTWFEKIVLGRAEYHLYFVPLIFQLYVLFPIILFLIRRYGIFAIIPAFIYQYWLFHSYSLQITMTDQQQYSYFGSWIWYFVLGVFFAESEKLVNKYRILIGLTGLIILVYGFNESFKNCWFILENRGNGIDATKFTRIPVLIYATGFLISAQIWGKFTTFLKVVLSPLALLGEHSYIIYLSHTLILRVFFGFWEKNVEWPYPVIASLIVGAAIWASFYLEQIGSWLKKPFYARIRA